MSSTEVRFPKPNSSLLRVGIVGIYVVGIISSIILTIYGIILTFTALAVPERGMLIFTVIYALLNVFYCFVLVLLLSVNAWRRYMYWLPIWLLATAVLLI